jgi:hypothetical protein
MLHHNNLATNDKPDPTPPPRPSPKSAKDSGEAKRGGASGSGKRRPYATPVLRRHG